MSAGGVWGRVWRRWARRWQGLARGIGRATGWKVWNPGLYGEPWHARFRRAYPIGDRPVILFGLNPGPYGMAQTGIPFTDVRRIRERLPLLHRRLVEAGERVEPPGLAPRGLRPFLTRTFESSAVRIYRFLELGWGDPERGWRRVVVANPCPLLFLDPRSGENRTPADLRRRLRARRGGAARVGELVARFERLRRWSARDAVRALRPRAAVLLGRNVQEALAGILAEEMGERAVIRWPHPARAVPDRWARDLLRRLEPR